jgi:hypothetical protein
MNDERIKRREQAMAKILDRFPENTSRSKNGYNTNLAAEFHVLSVLHRLGLTANLTLGNKKSVDIVVVRDRGRTLTIDVKGLAGMTSWPVDNIGDGEPNHFLVFVCYLGRISDTRIAPEVYVVPSRDVAHLIYVSPKGRRVVPLGRMRKQGAKYRDAWSQIAATEPS